MIEMKITLQDFSDDLYIKLDKKFRIEFIDNALRTVGGYKKLAKVLNVSIPTILAWKRGIDSAYDIHFIPMWAIRKISKIFNNQKFNIKEIQNHIQAYSMKSGRYQVSKPKLPIQDCIELREIVTHLMCDGSALLTPQRTSKYVSTSLESVREFRNELKAFGKMEGKYDEKIKIRKEKKIHPRQDNYILGIPKVIPRVLSNKLNITFRSSKARLPKEFFRGERVLLSSIIRAFIIDEGYIRDAKISLVSGNRLLLEDIKTVCNLLGYKTGKIRNTKSAYEISISAESTPQLYKDIMKINPLPISYKQKALELAKHFVTHQSNFSDLDKLILNNLSIKPMSIAELSENIRVRGRSIWFHLKKLKQENRVKMIKKRVGKGGAWLWTTS